MSIQVRDQVAATAYVRSYLPEVVRGVGLTLRHFFGNLLGRRAKRDLQTLRYPEEKRVYPPRFRGQHRLLSREDGSPRCVACYMCATACPAFCIHIVAAESADSEIEKYPAAFEIDMLRCVYCGLCVEACPEDAIRMDTGVHTGPTFNRQDALVGRVDLMAFLGQPGTRPAFGAQNSREGKPRGS